MGRGGPCRRSGAEAAERDARLLGGRRGRPPSVAGEGGEGAFARSRPCHATIGTSTAPALSGRLAGGWRRQPGSAPCGGDCRSPGGPEGTALQVHPGRCCPAGPTVLTSLTGPRDGVAGGAGHVPELASAGVAMDGSGADRREGSEVGLEPTHPVPASQRILDSVRPDLTASSDERLVLSIARWRDDALAEAYRRHAGPAFALAKRVLWDAGRGGGDRAGGLRQVVARAGQVRSGAGHVALFPAGPGAQPFGRLPAFRDCPPEPRGTRSKGAGRVGLQPRG